MDLKVSALSLNFSDFFLPRGIIYIIPFIGATLKVGIFSSLWSSLICYNTRVVINLPDENYSEKPKPITEIGWSDNIANYKAKLVLVPAAGEFMPDCYFCALAIEDCDSSASIKPGDEVDNTQYIQMWNTEMDTDGEAAKLYLEMVRELISHCGLRTEMYGAR